ncbi:OpgC domain-containing protein [Rathayibacter sp. VKM Ac-2835]|uniref:OpgC domain-containing protein n=1 Tax=Rathayibacter sp. VKM Ac-2835 TaxID=2739043 RepID=UPI00156399D3|nr:OpgC domain-containing protein [Rathayibacter sp. VKM Ac-2835]NRG42574.1 OpgC domain-containing protein [Rathayibacter sp. VKM Ac-2835]
MPTVTRRPRRLAVLAAIAAAALLAGAAAAPVLAAEAEEPATADSVFSPATGAYFGASLDWSVDSAASQADRLGRSSAVLEHSAALPISETETSYLAQFLRQAEGEGALAAVSLRPEGDLADFDRADAEQAVGALARARAGEALPLYVRFAPDMNATWVPWGQRPEEYVDAFRIFAQTLHADLPDAVVVWSPTAGESYPFSAAAPTGSAALDTDGDGLLGAGDDPYAPYYPGDDVVDWVGLAAYHDPSGGGAPRNALPADGELAADLSGAGALDFYGEYAEATGTPMLLETAAFYSPGAGGPGELALKQAWWRQVMAAASDEEYPLLDAVLWRDSAATRAVVGEVVIDWSISGSGEIAAAFAADAAASDLVSGPVYTPFTAASAGPATGGTLGGTAAWIVVALTLLVAAGATAWGLSRRRSTALAYDGPPNRDLRIDLLRGVAIVFVVINHIALVSIWQNATQEAIGMVSGAELFVLFSGAVLGLVHRPKVLGGGIGEVTLRTGRRAVTLYLTALVVTLVVGLVSLIDVVRSTPATTYIDQGTGAAGSEATGRVYDLYENIGSLLRYPVDPSIIVDLAALRLGPWQVNVLGFYVVMLALSPLVLWALSRGRWLPVLLVSWAVYAVQAFLRLRVLPSQFEDSFPLLTWQALFVTGVVAGFHRREIVAWFATRVGRIVLAVCVMATAGLALFSWNNPYLSSTFDLRLGLIPANTFSDVYSAAFERTTLDPGRVLNVLLVVVTAYAALTVLWKPIHRLLGWFFVPLGQATLYVFVMHVVFVLVIANIPVLREGNPVVDSIAYLVVLALLWLMVRTRFLFRVVPR